MKNTASTPRVQRMARRVLAGITALCCLGLAACGSPAPTPTPSPSASPGMEVIAAPSFTPALTPSPTATPGPSTLPATTEQPLLPTSMLPAPGEQRYASGSIPLPDGGRILAALSLICQSRPLGSAQEEAVGNLIERELAAAGLTVTKQRLTPETTGFTRATAVNRLSTGSGAVELTPITGSAEGNVSGPILLYRENDPIPESVEGCIVIAPVTSPLLGLIQAMDLGKPAGYVLVGDSQTAFAVMNNLRGSIVARADSMDGLPKTGHGVLSVLFGAQNYESYNIQGSLGQGDKILLLCAHYDSYPLSPGANDNGAGVALLLELARLAAPLKDQLGYELRFVFFTGEEDGLIGSTYYVQNLTAGEKDRLAAVANLDMFAAAAGGEPRVYTSDGESNFATNSIAVALSGYDLRLPTFLKEDRSDHAVFTAIGVPALMIAQSDDDTAYHSPADTIDALSMDYIDTACAWCMALILSAVD